MSPHYTLPISQTTPPHALKRDSQVLQHIMAKISQLDELNAIWARCVDEKLAKHCQVAHLEKHCLFLITHSATWATQLRFAAPDILTKLRQHDSLKELKKIHCQIVPPKGGLKMPERSVACLSLETHHTVLEIAKSIRCDRLRGVIEKIAGHTKKS